MNLSAIKAIGIPAAKILTAPAIDNFKKRFELYRLQKGVDFLNLMLIQGFKNAEDARKFYDKCAGDEKFMKSLMGRIDDAIRTSSPTAILTIASILANSIDEDNVRLDVSPDEAIMLSALDSIPESEIRLFWLLCNKIKTGVAELTPGLLIEAPIKMTPQAYNLRIESQECILSETGLDEPYTLEGLIAMMNDLIQRRILLSNPGERIGGGIYGINFIVGRITTKLHEHINHALGGSVVQD